MVKRFPTIESLAAADEREVLALWSGMGYYRRARNLHAAAKEVVAKYGGRVPSSVEELQTLPGVGRYTAGAIASMVYGKADPLVDGNVARVLVRVEGKKLGSEESVNWAWGKAEGLMRVCERERNDRVSPAALNEGLMELGAVVCTPRGPNCGVCPLRGECRARRAGMQEAWPRPKRVAKRRKLYCAAVVVEDGRGRLLVEQRGDSGMWARLWQAPTLEQTDRRVTKPQVERWLGVEGVARRERFQHGTTHREVEFEVWTGASSEADIGRCWMTRNQIARLGLSNPQRRILLGA
jgi:A/G-specific adenine glycosylase